MADWNVVAKVRVMPADVDVNLDRVVEAMTKLAGDKCAVHSILKKPIGFGLVALEVNLLLNDKKGGMDDVFEEIKKVPGVGEAEVIDLNRL